MSDPLAPNRRAARALHEHALDLSRDELRATARATAETRLEEAIAAIGAVVELAGEIPRAEGSAMADAVTLADAALRRLRDADRLARARRR